MGLSCTDQAVRDRGLPVRTPQPVQSRTLHRHGAALEVQARDEAEAGEIVTVVSCAGDVIAVRRTSYEATDGPAEVRSQILRELEAMIAKIRRGGIDARLPAFSFVPPQLSR